MNAMVTTMKMEILEHRKLVKLMALEYLAAVELSSRFSNLYGRLHFAVPAAIIGPHRRSFESNPMPNPTSCGAAYVGRCSWHRWNRVEGFWRPPQPFLVADHRLYNIG